jgi:hypothetical protein
MAELVIDIDDVENTYFCGAERRRAAQSTAEGTWYVEKAGFVIDERLFTEFKTASEVALYVFGKNFTDSALLTTEDLEDINSFYEYVQEKLTAEK